MGDKNVSAVCDYWRSKQKPDYRLDFSEMGGDGGGDGFSGERRGIFPPTLCTPRPWSSFASGQEGLHFTYSAAVPHGFNKAARLIEQMEQVDGIVGPADGSKPRPVR